MDYQFPKYPEEGKDFTNLTKEHREETKIFYEEALNLLDSIKVNTASLSTIVSLIAKNNENQNEIIDVITELLKIATIRGNPKEATSAYRKIMNKINLMEIDAETIMKLANFAMFVGNIFITKGIM